MNCIKTKRIIPSSDCRWTRSKVPDCHLLAPFVSQLWGDSKGMYSGKFLQDMALGVPSSGTMPKKPRWAAPPRHALPTTTILKCIKKCKGSDPSWHTLQTQQGQAEVLTENQKQTAETDQMSAHICKTWGKFYPASTQIQQNKNVLVSLRTIFLSGKPAPFNIQSCIFIT